MSEVVVTQVVRTEEERRAILEREPNARVQTFAEMEAEIAARRRHVEENLDAIFHQFVEATNHVAGGGIDGYVAMLTRVIDMSIDDHGSAVWRRLVERYGRGE